ncbi:hypothetical protein KP509_04G054600 [Ceratopteris richardii]|uniref:glucose-6-phosphate 1-epimerase n=1 Tax=Ceratopteris richardii TaxID=49495 RepID=A0A8T2V0H3_CERRI|nr:hypothetical protein KP509_04G054600 [Ceratopteris richardii]
MSASAAETSAVKPDEGPRASVQFRQDANGLDVAILKDPRGFSAQVHLHGGQITAWKNAQGEDLLFVSSKAVFKPPKPIRGGMLICFPQFSNFGMIEQHGFACNQSWAVDPDPSPLPPAGDDRASLDLILKQSNSDKQKIWSYSFEFRLRVVLGPEGELGLTARVRNTDPKAFTFTIAFQTYFSVRDISEVRVEGLETTDYLDGLQNSQLFTEQGDALTFEGEVDRVYVNTPTTIAVIDHEKKTTFVLKKDGFPDAGVWNPWEKKAKALTDLEDGEYKHMICVQPGSIQKPITLKPGEEWMGRLKILTVFSSYHSGRLDPMRVLSSFDSV